MRTKKERIFIHLSCLFAVIHALGYAWIGIQDGYNICIIAMILLDLFYIPACTIKNIKVFPVYLAFFSIVLIFITAFTTSKLYNNYSALLCLYVAILIFPRYKHIFLGLYLVFSAFAFILANDPVYFLVIHYARTLWIYAIYDFIIYVKYERKPILLFDEDIEILEQLINGEQMKNIELNGLSDRTIRRRISAAIKRNGFTDIKELKELYIQTYKRK